MEMVRATVARDSFFDFPTAERMIPTGPNTTGKNKNATAPRTIPQVEKTLLVVGTACGKELNCVGCETGANWGVSAGAGAGAGAS